MSMTAQQAYALAHPLTDPDDMFTHLRHLTAAEAVPGVGALQSILAVDR